jgi:hypothetical protein
VMLTHGNVTWNVITLDALDEIVTGRPVF